MAKTKVHGEYLDASVISGQTQVTAVGADSVLIFDATDNALKKALLSDVIETVADGDISTAKIADDAVTSAKLDTNIDIAGTFDVTGATVLDSTLAVAGDANFDSGTLFVDVSADNVGIGTTSPSYNLTISSADEDHLRLENGSELGIIRLTDDGILDLWAHGSDEITFRNGTGTGTETMRIDSSGNVGIRNTSPASHNSLGGNHLVVGDGTGNQNLYLYSATDGYGHVAFGDSNTNGSSAQYAGLIQYHHTNDIMQFYTGSAERMRLTGSGLTFNGDSAAANALDDYEEGNYAPTFVASGGTAPSQTGTGKYVKVGSVVHCHGQITWTSAGSGGSANLHIVLPFTVLSNARAGGAIGINAGVQHSANHSLHLSPEVNDNKMYLLETQPDSGGHDHLNYGNVTTNGSQIFSFSVTYVTG